MRFYDDPTLEADLERALAEPDSGLVPRWVLESMLASVQETKARMERLAASLVDESGAGAVTIRWSDE